MFRKTLTSFFVLRFEPITFAFLQVYYFHSLFYPLLLSRPFYVQHYSIINYTIIAHNSNSNRQPCIRWHSALSSEPLVLKHKIRIVQKENFVNTVKIVKNYYTDVDFVVATFSHFKWLEILSDWFCWLSGTQKLTPLRSNCMLSPT